MHPATVDLSSARVHSPVAPSMASPYSFCLLSAAPHSAATCCLQWAHDRAIDVWGPRRWKRDFEFRETTTTSPPWAGIYAGIYVFNGLRPGGCGDQATEHRWSKSMQHGRHAERAANLDPGIP